MHLNNSMVVPELAINPTNMTERQTELYKLFQSAFPDDDFQFEFEEIREFSDGIVIELQIEGFPRDICDLSVDLNGDNIYIGGNEDNSPYHRLCNLAMQVEDDSGCMVEIRLTGTASYSDYCDDEYDGYFNGRLYLTNAENKTASEVASIWLDAAIAGEVDDNIAKARSLLKLMTESGRRNFDTSKITDFLSEILSA